MDYKVIVLTRHSFKGVDFFNSQKIILSNDLILPNPFLSWNETNNADANFHIQIDPINNAVKQGLKEIGEHPSCWSGLWKEIRVDFLYQRTFETGRILRDRIKKNKPELTAVINKKDPETLFNFNDNSNIDAIVFPVQDGNFTSQVSSLPTQIQENELKLLTREFLNSLNECINQKKYIHELPPVFVNGNINSYYYYTVFSAADLIVMSAFYKPPMDLIYGNKNYQYQNIVVKKAAEYLKYALSNQNSLQFQAYQTFPFLEFFRSNDNVILLTHDIVQFEILKSLDLPIYPINTPFQSYLFIQSKEKTCLMFTAPDLNLLGVFEGNITKLLWKGLNSEWNQKVANLDSYIDPDAPLYPVKPAFSLLVT